MAITVQTNPNEDIGLAPHHYIGLAADTKPTVASHDGLPKPTPGSTFWNYDTFTRDITYDGTNWSAIAAESSFGTRFFTSSAATTTTITAAALADVAGEYVGQVVIPLQGAMAGEARYVIAYNGTNQLTVSPAWAADPDAGGAIQFAVVSGAFGIMPIALGTDGSTVTDSATTVLGAIGANNNNNAFDSTNVAANADGSTLEREEYIQAELTKVPKSDAAVSWNATALASVNAEVDTALNTIVPASPTAGSLNDALSKAAGGNTFNKTTDSLEALSDKVALDSTVAKTAELISAGVIDFNATAKTSIQAQAAAALAATANKRQAGVKQIFQKQLTTALTDGTQDVTVATVTAQDFDTVSVSLRSNGAQPASLVSIALYAGASKVLTLISPADGARVNIAAADQQVAWPNPPGGKVTLAATKTFVATLVGTGTDAIDVTFTFSGEACADGGYLA